MAISDNGKIIVTGSGDGAIKIWNKQQEDNTSILLNWKTSIRDGARKVMISNEYLIAASYHNQINIWNIHTGELIKTIKTLQENNHQVESICVSNDGKRIISGSFGGEIIVTQNK